jgi:hypothetical protein
MEDFLAVQVLMKHCYMFTTNKAVDIIASGDHDHLGKLLLDVVSKYVQLNKDQVCGLITAAVLLDGPCWLAVQ